MSTNEKLIATIEGDEDSNFKFVLEINRNREKQHLATLSPKAVDWLSQLVRYGGDPLYIKSYDILVRIDIPRDDQETAIKIRRIGSSITLKIPKHAYSDFAQMVFEVNDIMQFYLLHHDWSKQRANKVIENASLKREFQILLGHSD